jgi:hypothetical protein
MWNRVPPTIANQANRPWCDLTHAQTVGTAPRIGGEPFGDLVGMGCANNQPDMGFCWWTAKDTNPSCWSPSMYSA